MAASSSLPVSVPFVGRGPVGGAVAVISPLLFPARVLRSGVRCPRGLVAGPVGSAAGGGGSVSVDGWCGVGVGRGCPPVVPRMRGCDCPGLRCSSGGAVGVRSRFAIRAGVGVGRGRRLSGVGGADVGRCPVAICAGGRRRSLGGGGALVRGVLVSRVGGGSSVGSRLPEVLACCEVGRVVRGWECSWALRDPRCLGVSCVLSPGVFLIFPGGRDAWLSRGLLLLILILIAGFVSLPRRHLLCIYSNLRSLLVGG